MGFWGVALNEAKIPSSGQPMGVCFQAVGFGI
jgi:hypothetical protein